MRIVIVASDASGSVSLATDRVFGSLAEAGAELARLYQSDAVAAAATFYCADLDVSSQVLLVEKPQTSSEPAPEPAAPAVDEEYGFTTLAEEPVLPSIAATEAEALAFFETPAPMAVDETPAAIAAEEAPVAEPAIAESAAEAVEPPLEAVPSMWAMPEIDPLAPGSVVFGGTMGTSSPAPVEEAQLEEPAAAADAETLPEETPALESEPASSEQAAGAEPPAFAPMEAAPSPWTWDLPATTVEAPAEAVAAEPAVEQAVQAGPEAIADPVAPLDEVADSEPETAPAPSGYLLESAEPPDLPVEPLGVRSMVDDLVIIPADELPPSEVDDVPAPEGEEAAEASVPVEPALDDAATLLGEAGVDADVPASADAAEASTGDYIITEPAAEPAAAAAQPEEADRSYEPGALNMNEYTCDDCVYVATCPNHHQKNPSECGSFQWRSS
jgi:hypothetical protein